MAKVLLAVLVLALGAAVMAAFAVHSGAGTAHATSKDHLAGNPEVRIMAKFGLLRLGLLAAMSALMVSILGLTLSGALFTSQVSVGSNVFNTGTLTLGASPASAVWADVTAGAPGDRATGSLTVSNSGSLALRYAVTGGNTNSTLAAAMNLRIAVRGGASCDFPFFNTDGTTTTLSDDTQVYSGSLNTAALIGSNAQGAQAGDRTLAASGSEVLCFGVVLPTSAGNTSQGLNNTATFTFDAEQTANNP